MNITTFLNHFFFISIQIKLYNSAVIPSVPGLLLFIAFFKTWMHSDSEISAEQIFVYRYVSWWIQFRLKKKKKESPEYLAGPSFGGYRFSYKSLFSFWIFYWHNFNILFNVVATCCWYINFYNIFFVFLMTRNIFNIFHCLRRAQRVIV